MVVVLGILQVRGQYGFCPQPKKIFLVYFYFFPVKIIFLFYYVPTSHSPKPLFFSFSLYLSLYLVQYLTSILWRGVGGGRDVILNIIKSNYPPGYKSYLRPCPVSLQTDLDFYQDFIEQGLFLQKSLEQRLKSKFWQFWISVVNSLDNFFGEIIIGYHGKLLTINFCVNKC